MPVSFEVQKEIDYELSDPNRIRSMLINSHNWLKNNKEFKKSELWYFVSQITGFGSTRSMQICDRFGWDANKKCGKISLN